MLSRRVVGETRIWKHARPTNHGPLSRKTLTCWWLIGNTGMYPLYNIFPYSLLTPIKLRITLFSEFYQRHCPAHGDGPHGYLIMSEGLGEAKHTWFWDMTMDAYFDKLQLWRLLSLLADLSATSAKIEVLNPKPLRAHSPHKQTCIHQCPFA